VRLLLLERGLGDLGVGEDADDGAVLLDALELAGDGLAVVLGVLLGVLGEGLLLAPVPVLVESPLDLIGKICILLAQLAFGVGVETYARSTRW
jgi:hypothetical protein